MEKEKTLILIKPDGLVRHLIGKIISRFEDAGLKILNIKMLQIEDQLANDHYQKDIEEKYGARVRNGLIEYIKEGPIIAVALEGVDAISVTRKIVGSTYPNESLPGTIRGDFAHISKDFANEKEINVRNLIHASSDIKDATRELALYFSPNELHDYKTAHDILSLKE